MATTPSKKASPTPRSKPAAASPVPATEGDAPKTAPVLRLKMLVDRVTASTGGKKKGVKEIVEATLCELGLALQNGEMLNLPDFGKVRVAKGLGAAPGTAMTLKLRRSGDGPRKKPAQEALADQGDQG